MEPIWENIGPSGSIFEFFFSSFFFARLIEFNLIFLYLFFILGKLN